MNAFSQQATHLNSYIYTSTEGKCYLYPDSNTEKLSFIPAIQIQHKRLVFTFNQQFVVWYDQTFIYSLLDLFKKINIPENLDQDFLNKIAITANYLAVGDEYKYVPGSAKTKDKSLCFLVENDENLYQVTIPFFREEEKINYEMIENIKNITTGGT